MKNRLLTSSLEHLMPSYPLYSQDGKGKDALCIAAFCIGNARWYILEADNEGADVTMFGIVVGLCEDEYGYISLNELAELEVETKIPNMRKLYVEPIHGTFPSPVGNIADFRLQQFLNRIHSDDA